MELLLKKRDAEPSRLLGHPTNGREVVGPRAFLPVSDGVEHHDGVSAESSRLLDRCDETEVLTASAVGRTEEREVDTTDDRRRTLADLPRTDSSVRGAAIFAPASAPFAAMVVIVASLSSAYGSGPIARVRSNATMKERRESLFSSRPKRTEAPGMLSSNNALRVCERIVRTDVMVRRGAARRRPRP